MFELAANKSGVFLAGVQMATILARIKILDSPKPEASEG